MGAALVGRVAFAGGRSVSPAAFAALGGPAVVSAVVRSGRAVGVCCCVGAVGGVRSVLAGALAAGRLAPSAVAVFAAFGPGGAGALGAVSGVASVAALAAAGCAVSWWAGGPAAVAARVRLAARAAAVVRWAAAGGPGSALVVFFGGGPCVGSVAAAGLAARLGLPVVAFAPSGWALPVLGAGCWAAVGGAGCWAAGWRWVPAVACLPGF